MEDILKNADPFTSQSERSFVGDRDLRDEMDMAGGASGSPHAKARAGKDGKLMLNVNRRSSPLDSAADEFAIYTQPSKSESVTVEGDHAGRRAELDALKDELEALKKTS